MESPYRDTFRIWGYRFGSGKKSLAVIGALRGDEVHQQLVCAELISRLRVMEEQGHLIPGHEILVVPSANPFSTNIEKRFWAMDNTDINHHIQVALKAHALMHRDIAHLADIVNRIDERGIIHIVHNHARRGITYGFVLRGIIIHLHHGLNIPIVISMP